MSTVDLACDDTGQGPAVVLIHGHPFNRTMWAPQLEALREQFRVIAPDLRGYGDSPVTAGTVTMAQLAADVSHLLDTKGIDTAALVGLSMGGLVVMELATAEPQRWWALGFVATTAQPVTEEERADRLAKAQIAAERGMRPLADEMAARLFGPAPDQALVDRIMAMMLATSPPGAAAALRGRAERPDYRPLLRSLRTSSLVCVGDHDTWSTSQVTAELASSLAEPQLVTIEGAGHLPNLERPGDFNEHLLSFLSRALPHPQPARD
jgi:pimeloyl-ACP methyl ester carboxylesterase